MARVLVTVMTLAFISARSCASKDNACLWASEVEFLQHLSSDDLFLLCELVGLVPRERETISGGSPVEMRDSLRCLPRESKYLLSRALSELGHVTYQAPAAHALPLEHRLKHSLDELYQQRCKEPSDINEHLPVLRRYASKCATVAEMGIRGLVSTYAFLKGLAESTLPDKKLWCVDIQHVDIEPEKEMASRAGIDLQFFQMRSTHVTFPHPVDLLFIDTFHVYGQLKRELAQHHANVTKFIILHDTTVDGEYGEVVRYGFTYFPDILMYENEFDMPQEELMQGLWPAVEEFLENHPEWRLEHRFTHNSGLTILARGSRGAGGEEEEGEEEGEDVIERRNWRGYSQRGGLTNKALT
jgi:hypothetical protein